LIYGENVRLRHKTSGRYLAISKVSSSESFDKFVCQLIPDANSASNLTLEPRYKTRTEGENVFYDDKVLIVHKSGGGQYVSYIAKNNLVVTYSTVTEGW
jgi:hypothetical protein